MNVKDLIENLKKSPKDYEVCLSRMIGFDDEDNYYEIILDVPVIGLAENAEDKEVRLIIKSDKDNLIKNFNCKIAELD